jgi:hypothetical protein
MECCSPDVGDCQKCHPELWIQKGGSYCHWVPKGPIVPKSRKGGKGGLPLFSRRVNRLVRHRVRTQKKRTV